MTTNTGGPTGAPAGGAAGTEQGPCPTCGRTVRRGRACCAEPSCWGWSPAPLAADTLVKRVVDRFLPRTGLPVLAYFAAVVLLVNLAPHLPTVSGRAVDGVAALAAGGWCALNFWRCRHAHCVVTGAGWLGLALFSFAEAALGHSLIGGREGLAFLVVLAAGLAFEGGWYLTNGTNAVHREASGTGRRTASRG